MDPFVAAAGAVGTGVGLLVRTAYDYVNAEKKKEKQFEAMEKEYPVTRYPVIPDIMKHAVGWETPNQFVGYAVGADNEQYASDESILFIQDYLNWRILEKKWIVPRNAVAVSQVFKDTFAVGTSCHDFVPKKFESEPNAFFTYRMIAPTVQATYYNVDGTAYLAGVTYYLTPKSEKLVSLKCERILVNATVCAGVVYPPCDRKTDALYKNHGQYGRYCNTAKKHVLVYVKEDKMYHWVLVPRRDMAVLEFCKECNEEHKNYEFVPKAWKKKVEEPVKEDAPAAKEGDETTPIEETVKEKKEEQVDGDLDEYEFLENENLDALTIN